MAAEGNLIKLYPQFMQLTDRKDTANPVTSPCLQNNIPVSKVKPLDPRIYKDFIRTKDTFESIRNNAIQIKTQVNTFDNKAHKNKELTHTVFAALSPIIPIRRISSVPDNVEDGNYARAAGIIGLMAVNLPEDGRDIRNGIRQISDKVIPDNVKESINKQYPKMYEQFVHFSPAYDYKEFQHSFSFFRGTWLEPLLNLPGKTGQKISNILYNIDKPLYDTALGQKILKFLRLEKGKFSESNIIDIKGNEILARSVKGGNCFTRLIGKAMLRIPVLGIYALSLLELPSIIRSFNKTDDKEERVNAILKQMAKSTIFVTSVISGIGILGAVGAKKGPLGSLIGMGLGSVIGSFTSKKAGNFIDQK